MFKVTTLIENHPGLDSNLYYEHGLSLYIEYNGLKILFDTGQSGHFIDNAKILKKDLSALDYIFISHGHYDHANGVPRLIKEYDPKTIYVGEGFFNKKYKIKDDELVYNGINFEKDERFKEIKADFNDLNNGVYVFKNFTRTNDFELVNKRFRFSDNSIDEFKDEIAIALDTEKGLVLIVGCSHVGIVNIVNFVKETTKKEIYMIIGGTHLVEADSNRLRKTFDFFKHQNIKYLAMSHCTGEHVVELEKEFKEQFILNVTGNIINK